jgi:cytochrome c oxidase assembly protein subunit 11
VPSVTPFVTATHFKKLECFCFTQQTLKAGESREMPVRFVVDAGVDREVRTITLSYAFFNTDKASAQRYGAAPQDPIPGAHDHHAHAAGG